MKNMEKTIIAAVILSSFLALLEELAGIAEFSGTIKGTVSVLCFLFDLLFSVLFISSSVKAVRGSTFIKFIRSGGWLDLVWSLPLLLCYSLPAMVVIIAAEGSAVGRFFVTVGLFCDALCITGILRVSRLAGIARSGVLFSPMTGHHVYAACRAVIVSVAGVFLLFAPVSMMSLFNRAHGLPEIVLASVRFAGSVGLFAALSGLLFIYSGYFHKTVSIPVSVLNRGFRRREFCLKAEIINELKDDDIYRLAEFYNEAYLPAKMRQNISSPEPAQYKIDTGEIKGFFERKKSL